MWSGDITEERQKNNNKTEKKQQISNCQQKRCAMTEETIMTHLLYFKYQICNRELSISVHTFVVLLVLTACDVLKPLLVFEIPLNGLLYTLFKLERWFPTKFPLKLA